MNGKEFLHYHSSGRGECVIIMYVFGDNITGGGVVVHITTGGVLTIRYRRVVIFDHLLLLGIASAV